METSIDEAEFTNSRVEFICLLRQGGSLHNHVDPVMGWFRVLDQEAADRWEAEQERDREPERSNEKRGNVFD
jgi:hypothetical protein